MLRNRKSQLFSKLPSILAGGLESGWVQIRINVSLVNLLAEKQRTKLNPSWISHRIQLITSKAKVPDHSLPNEITIIYRKENSQVSRNLSKSQITILVLQLRGRRHFSENCLIICINSPMVGLAIRVDKPTVGVDIIKIYKELTATRIEMNKRKFSARCH